MKQKIVILLFITFFTALCCGCSETSKNPQKTKDTNPASTASSRQEASNNTEAPIKPPEIALVKKENKTKYLLTNGIQLVHKEISLDTKNGTATLNYVQISGLKNKSIEDKVNKAILADLEAEVKKYDIERNLKGEQLRYFYADAELNANNLLSVSLAYFYTKPIYGLLYKLTDGERVYLKDIFTTGTDYVSLLNTKVTEGIIGKAKADNRELDGGIDYEEFLKEPFSTIKPDQNFVLSNSTLYIIFLPGEGGFASRISVPIALSSVDEYIDIADRYSGTERKNHLYTNLIIRHNNNFFIPISTVVKRTKGDIWVTYNEISGLRDPALEKMINTTVKTGIEEALKNEYLTTLIKDPKNNSGTDFAALISTYNVYNNYGILCVNRDVVGQNYARNKDLDKLFTVYSFDLTKKRLLDTKTILNDYIIKNNVTEASFTNQVKMSLKQELTNIKASNMDALCSKVDYSLIKEKSLLYFSGEDTTEIHVYWKQDTINGLPSNIDCHFPLRNIHLGAPEDFFGW